MTALNRHPGLLGALMAAKDIFSRAAVVILLISAVAIGAKPAHSDELFPIVDVSAQGVVDDDSGTREMLLASAKGGPIDVIVEVNPDYAAAGLSSNRAGKSDSMEASMIGATQAVVLRSLQSPRNVHRFSTVPYLSMTVGRGDLNRLLNDPAVIRVIEDTPSPAAGGTDETRSAQAMSDLAMSNLDGVEAIQADELWRRNFRGQGKAIAILDSGVNYSHPAFRTKLVAEACFSRAVKGSARTFCRDGKNVSYQKNAGRNCPWGLNGCGNGTHVAGVALGNSKGYRGIAFRSKLIPVQIAHRATRDALCTDGKAPCVRSHVSDQMKALEYVFSLRNEFDIGGVYLGFADTRFDKRCRTDPRAAIANKLRAARIPVIVPTPTRPIVTRQACVSSMIAAGSGGHVGAGVPWKSIMSAPISLVNGPGLGSSYVEKSGVGQAAAHVVGGWTLLKQARPKAPTPILLRALACTQGGGSDFIQLGSADDFVVQGPRRMEWQFETAADLDDWKQYGTWGIDDGAAVPVASPIGYIMSTESCWGNVDVVANVSQDANMIVSATQTGSRLNSIKGYLFNARAPGAGRNWFLGSISLLHELTYDDLSNDCIQCGGSVPVCTGRVDQKSGDIFTYEVKIRDGKIDFIVDGALICSADNGILNWGSVGFESLNTDLRVERVTISDIPFR